MANPQKAAAVAELAESFRESSGAVLTEYRGLTVKELKELRRALGEDASYAVAKNTLTKIAAKDAGVDLDEALLVGPTAIAFITGDAVNAAKGLRNFAKDHDALVIKGGVLDGKALSTDEIKKLADLESREVLLAQLAGGMKASLNNAAALFNAPLSQAARVLGALQAKAESDPSVLAAGADVPQEPDTADSDAAPEPEADAATTEADASAEAPTDDADQAPADTAESDSTEG